MRKKIILGTILLVIILLGTTGAVGYRLAMAPKTFVSPVAKTEIPQVLAAETVPKKVFGFLPFWNLPQVDNASLKNVDLVYYFSVPIKADGSFDKTDPGWTRMGQLAKFNRKFGLTISCLDQDAIVAVIQNPASQKKVIADTLALMKAQDFTDLDVDFEYVGVPPSSMVTNYSRFINDFATKLHDELPGATLSVATLADAVWKTRMTNPAQLAQSADYIIIMAYDFTRLSSLFAGPVAPLFGKERFEYDVYTTVTDYLKVVPPDKIVLGIPFYGYEWPVTGSAANSFVLGASTFGPALSTYKRTMTTVADNNVSVNFDDFSKSPWFSYFDKDSRTWRQVWFENERSLGLKLDLVNQAGLSGIGIWALGYEGDNSKPLWDIVDEKIK